MKYKLSQLFTILGGGTPKTTVADYWGGAIPWLSVKDFNNDSRYVYYTEKSITEKGLANSATSLLQKDDIIISARGTVGEIASIPFPMAFNQSCYGLRAVRDIVDSDFLYYLVKAKVNELKHNSHGSVFDTITRDTFEGIETEIPCKDVQRKIGKLLSLIDEKIANNKAINDNLQQQAQALFDDAIKSCANYVSLGSIADVKGGKRLPKGINLITQPNTHPYIRVRDLNNALILQKNAEFEYVDDVTQKGIARYIVKEQDVLLSIVGTIGLTALVHNSLNNANLTENCVKITNLKAAFPEYILLFLRSEKGIAEIAKNTVGAVQAKLPLKNIQAISIPLLSNSQLLQLQNTLSSIFAVISNNLSENIRLASLRDMLLPKLMSGEIDVSDVEI